ncbi:MAG: hypothetical protein ACD_12C00541G0001 [uncultured bacterium]|nr:MAG: hypothetical protein ACD_12C00541G0001 [uncultured bacterium]
MARLFYPDLSYQLVGILFRIYNELGGGYQEKLYQRAIRLELMKQKIKFREQEKIALKFDGSAIGKYYIDFVIDNKIVLEIKVTPHFYKRDIKQVIGYLNSTGLKLGILAAFTKDGVKFKRIINANQNKNKISID